MNMKNWLTLFVALLSVTCFGLDDNIRQGLNAAVDNARVSLRQANLGRVPVALLPIRGDADEIVAGRLKNVLTDVGCTVTEGKDAPMLQKLIELIDWTKRKEDLMDPNTVSRFGSLNCAKILVYGSVRSAGYYDGRVYVELELHATEVATARHFWGGIFVGRIYPGKDMEGIVSLDPEVKLLLAKNFDIALLSLKEKEGLGKFNNIKYTAVIPLAGDIDKYLTGLTLGILTKTNLHPVSSDIMTVSQVRSAQRDGVFAADAVLYGALRDLSRTRIPAHDTPKELAYKINADIQLFLEDAKSGEILWSETVTMSEQKMDKNPNPKPTPIIEKVAEHSWVKWVVGGTVLIIALGIAVGIARSATNVR